MISTWIIPQLFMPDVGMIMIVHFRCRINYNSVLMIHFSLHYSLFVDAKVIAVLQKVYFSGHIHFIHVEVEGSKVITFAKLVTHL